MSKTLVMEIADGYHLSSQASLPFGMRDDAIRLIERLIVDADALLFHAVYLKSLVKKPLPQKAVSTPIASSIVAREWTEMADEYLAALLLSPATLKELGDKIYESPSPGPWFSLIADLGEELREDEEDGDGVEDLDDDLKALPESRAARSSRRDEVTFILAASRDSPQSTDDQRFTISKVGEDLVEITIVDFEQLVAEQTERTVPVLGIVDDQGHFQSLEHRPFSPFGTVVIEKHKLGLASEDPSLLDFRFEPPR